MRTELAQYDDAIAIARNQLAALVGAGPQRGDVDRRGRAGARAGDRAARRDSARPRRRAGRRSSRRAGASRPRGSDIEVAQALFYPNVNLVAFVGLSSIGLSKLFDDGSGIAGVGPAIHLPIFEGGRLNANLRGRDADADLAVSTYNQAVIDAVRDVADALSSIDGLARVAAEQARAREATTDAYNLAVIRYKAGLGNYLTVLTAQTQQLVQDRLDADLKARAFELDVNLARALGGGYADAAPRQRLRRAAPPPRRAEPRITHSKESVMAESPLRPNRGATASAGALLLIAGGVFVARRARLRRRTGASILRHYEQHRRRLRAGQRRAGHAAGRRHRACRSTPTTPTS